MDTGATISISCDTLTEFVDNAEDPTAAEDSDTVIVVGKPAAKPATGSTSAEAKSSDSR
jgi:hypothetical protein